MSSAVYNVIVKRSKVIKKLKDEAKSQGKTFELVELKRHTAIKVGLSHHTLGRHSEVDDLTARKFFAQFADELGKDWWRK